MRRGAEAQRRRGAEAQRRRGAEAKRRRGEEAHGSKGAEGAKGEVHEHTRWRGGRGATVMVALAI